MQSILADKGLADQTSIPLSFRGQDYTLMRETRLLQGQWRSMLELWPGKLRAPVFSREQVNDAMLTTDGLKMMGTLIELRDDNGLVRDLPRGWQSSIAYHSDDFILPPSGIRSAALQAAQRLAGTATEAATDRQWRDGLAGTTVLNPGR